jgi:TetR/AcrR family transcriptional repressor of nem operon
MYMRTNAGNTALITAGRRITPQKNRVKGLCGVKAMLLEARGHLPIADEVTRRNRMNVDVVAADFEARGSRHPREAARLWIAATAECALMELERGHRDPAARSALSALVQ